MTSVSSDRRIGVNSGAAIKVPCKAASTAALTLSGEQTVDGVALVTGDRVLVKNQASSVDNGVYVVDTGTWSRSVDFDAAYDAVSGTIVTVLDGTTNSNTYWRIATADPITIGTTALTFESTLSGDAESITFIAAGAGAVTRTMRSKARERISVLDYGAVADGGITDNAGPFALAMAAAGAGGSVWIPEGSNFYGFLTGITVNLFGLALEGDGDRSMLVNMNAAGQNLITVDGVQAVRLKNFSFAGHATSGHGIEIKNGAHRGYTENLFAVHVGGDCIRVTSGFGWTHIEPRFSTNFYTPSSTIGPFPYAAANALAEHGIKCVGGAIAGTQTIIGPLIEGMATCGLYLEAENSTVVGGTVEGNTLNIDIIGNQIKVYGTNLEAPDPGPSVRINGSLNVIDGCLNGGTYADLKISSGSKNTIRNCSFNNMTIDAGVIDTVIDNSWYGTNGGTYTDNGTGTETRKLYNTSNENQRAADTRSDSHVNFIRNGGFERWITASSLDGAAAGGYSVLNASTIARSGVGEADTTKITGHYSMKCTAAAVTTSGFEYQGPMPTAAEITDKVLSVSLTANAPGGVPFTIGIVFTRSSGGNISVTQSFTATSTTKQFAATFKVPSNTTSFAIRVVIAQANGVIYFDDLYATVGAAASYSRWDNLKAIEPEPTGWHALTASATPTIYGDTATYQSMTLTANITAIAFASMIPGLPIRLKLKQQGGGGGLTIPAAASWTVSGGTVRFVAATAPTLTAGANATDIYEAVFDGTDVWVSVIAQNMS